MPSLPPGKDWNYAFFTHFPVFRDGKHGNLLLLFLGMGLLPFLFAAPILIWPLDLWTDKKNDQDHFNTLINQSSSSSTTSVVVVPPLTSHYSYAVFQLFYTLLAWFPMAMGNHCTVPSISKSWMITGIVFAQILIQGTYVLIARNYYSDADDAEEKEQQVNSNSTTTTTTSIPKPQLRAQRELGIIIALLVLMAMYFLHVIFQVNNKENNDNNSENNNEHHQQQQKKQIEEGRVVHQLPSRRQSQKLFSARRFAIQQHQHHQPIDSEQHLLVNNHDTHHHLQQKEEEEENNRESSIATTTTTLRHTSRQEEALRRRDNHSDREDDEDDKDDDDDDNVATLHQKGETQQEQEARNMYEQIVWKKHYQSTNPKKQADESKSKSVANLQAPATTPAVSYQRMEIGNDDNDNEEGNGEEGEDQQQHQCSVVAALQQPLRDPTQDHNFNPAESFTPFDLDRQLLREKVLLHKNREDVSEENQDAFTKFFVAIHALRTTKWAQIVALVVNQGAIFGVYSFCLWFTGTFFSTKEEKQTEADGTRQIILFIIFAACMEVFAGAMQIISRLVDLVKWTNGPSLEMINSIQLTNFFVVFNRSLFQHIGSWDTLIILLLLHLAQHFLVYPLRLTKWYFDFSSRIQERLVCIPVIGPALYDESPLEVWRVRLNLDMMTRYVATESATIAYVFTLVFLRYGWNSKFYPAFASDLPQEDFERTVFFLLLNVGLEIGVLAILHLFVFDLARPLGRLCFHDKWYFWYICCGCAHVISDVFLVRAEIQFQR